MLPVKRLALNF